MIRAAKAGATAHYSRLGRCFGGAYFVDLVHEQLHRSSDRDFNREGLHIYTSLDPDLQRVATTAVESTVHVVDEQVDKLHAKDKKAGMPMPIRRWRWLP